MFVKKTSVCVRKTRVCVRKTSVSVCVCLSVCLYVCMILCVCAIVFVRAQIILRVPFQTLVCGYDLTLQRASQSKRMRDVFFNAM